MSQWSMFRDFVNAAPIGSIITRQAALLYVYKNRKNWTWYSRNTTMDSYRLVFNRLNILSNHHKRGQYKVNHHIREDVKLATLQKLAYPKKNWEEWFIPKDKIMQKCYGKDCIVEFLCKQADGVNDFLKRCDLISKNIDEKISEIPDDLSKEEILKQKGDIIYETYKEICKEINHPYIEQVIDDLTFQCGDSDGYYFQRYLS